MIRKSMFLGEYAAEFHLDDKSDPPRYHYAIIRRDTRNLLYWGRGTSIAELMRIALETLQRFHAESSIHAVAEPAAAKGAAAGEGPPRARALRATG